MHSILLVLILSWAVLAHASGDLLAEAREFLHLGKAEEALSLLVPHETEYAGQFEFDYLLGVAALEAGKADVAVFALERAVATNPDSAYAHADLAQAYLALGERDAAKETLQLASRINHDPAVSLLIQRKRNLLLQEEYAGQGHFNAFLEFGLGYDNNVNSATNSRDLVIPAFGAFTFTLGGNSIKLGSRFTQQRGGVSASYPLAKHTNVFGRVTGMQRIHSQYEEFDTSSLESVAGVTHQRGAHHFLLSLQNHDFLLNGRDYRYTLNGTAQWLWEVNSQTQAGAFAQVGKLIYPDADLRNTRRYVGGAFASQALAWPTRPVLHLSLYGGHEAAVADGVSYMGHRLRGGRLALENTWAEKWSSFISAGYEKRHYGGMDPLFLMGREDRQNDLSLGLVYRLPHGFSVRPTLSYINNHSNLTLNDYDRLESMLLVRKEF